MFEEGETSSRLKVNKQYAKSFEQRKQREHLDKAKRIYGNDLEGKPLKRYNGLLWRFFFLRRWDRKSHQLVKFQNLLSNLDQVAIQRCFYLWHTTGVFLRFSLYIDEAEDSDASEKKKDKKTTYKDMVRKDIMEKMEGGENLTSSEEFECNVCKSET